MKLLLTSAGIKNPSIEKSLVDLLGKPIAESSALVIPTAAYGHPMALPGPAWQFISGRADTPMCELGWKSLGVLELTALPSIDEESWAPMVRETDALLVGGGDALYLCHWMRQSGLADLLPSLRETVWVGLSAGSMVMTPGIGEDFVVWKPPGGGDRALGGCRLLDLPARGPRGSAGEHDGQRRTMGRRLVGPGVRDRRSDCHQSDGRCRRGRLRGVLETLHPVEPSGTRTSSPRAWRALWHPGRRRRSHGTAFSFGCSVARWQRRCRKPSTRASST